MLSMLMEDRTTVVLYALVFKITIYGDLNLRPVAQQFVAITVGRGVGEVPF